MQLAVNLLQSDEDREYQKTRGRQKREESEGFDDAFPRARFKLRSMSAAGRRAIAAAARARWAKYRGEKPTKTGGKRRKMSAAARAKMVRVARARWRKAKAAGRSRL